MSGILFVSSLATPLYGQESGGTDEEHRNAVELFLGGVTETDDSSTGLGVGLGYVRHLSSQWGLGVTGELSTSDVSRDWLAIVPVYLFPVGGLALLAGPAIGGLGGRAGGRRGSREDDERRRAVRGSLGIRAGQAVHVVARSQSRRNRWRHHLGVWPGRRSGLLKVHPAGSRSRNRQCGAVCADWIAKLELTPFRGHPIS